MSPLAEHMPAPERLHVEKPLSQIIIGRRFGPGKALLSPDVTLSYLPFGVDVGYQRFEGEFNGNGYTIRLNPFLAGSPLTLNATAP